MRREEQRKRGRKRRAGEGEMGKRTGRGKGRGRESQMPEGDTGPMDLMDLRLSGTTALPLGGRSERWREGEGSLTECRYRALCFEQPGHGAKEALVLPFSGTMIVNPINYLLSFQCVRLHAKPFK